MSGDPTEVRESFSWPEQMVREALEMAPRSSGPPATFSGVSTDSRSVRQGTLFVALRGERFDGHDHLAAAAAAGATGAVVASGTAPVPGLTYFEVPDTLRALGHLARARRRTISGPVIAITGTNGKTSTKEMLAAVLRTRYSTHATRANLNNLVGVPLTILEAPSETEALVVEAGANLPGRSPVIARSSSPPSRLSPTLSRVTWKGSARSRV